MNMWAHSAQSQKVTGVQRGRKLGPDAEASWFYEASLLRACLCTLQIKKGALEAKYLSSGPLGT